MATTADSPNATASFSLELNQDQKDIRDWVHGFAEDVVRPAAAEWDEREETPWPIIQEAAKIGLYGFEALAQFFADPTGLTLPIVNEELFWGDAGIGMAIMGTVAGRRRDLRPGHAASRSASGSRAASARPTSRRSARSAPPSPTPAPTSRRIRTTRQYDEATDEWVLNGQKAWATNGGIADVHVVVASVDRELGSRGHAAFVIPPTRQGIEQGARSRSTACAPRTPPTSSSTTAASRARSLLGGKEKLDERLARVREGRQRASRRPRCRPSRRRRPIVGAQALGIARAAYEYALDYAKEREQFGKQIIENQAIAFTLADMKIEIDAARLLVWRASWMAPQRASRSRTPRAR